MSQVTASAPEKPAFTTKELVFTAVFAALIAVCSWISIPTTVPFTLQTFAVFCTLEYLGGKKGFFAVLVYLLLGAVGIPVFSGFSGGMSALLNTTGGYLLGFLLTAGIYWIAEKISSKLWVRILALILGLAVCYAFGTAWFMIVYARSKEAIGLMTALSWCVLPFLLPDAVKMALAVIVADRLKKYVRI